MDQKCRDNSKRKCRINKNTKRILLALALAASFAALCSAGSYAYYSAQISKNTQSQEVAGMCFGEEHVIEADFSEVYERILPISIGDKTAFSFTAVYNGDLDAYVIPVLEIFDEEFSPADEIIINRLSENGNVIEQTALDEDGTCEFIGSPKLCTPGETLTYYYEIVYENISEERDTGIVPDFRLAAVQEKCNEDYIDEEGQDEDGRVLLFEELKKSDGGFDSLIIGFTVLTDAGDIYDISNGAGGEKVYAVCLSPDMVLGNPSETVITWYNKDSEEILKSCVISGENAKLDLRLSKKNDGLRIMYELSNQAGTVFSDIFVFSIDENGVSVSEEEEL